MYRNFKVGRAGPRLWRGKQDCLPSLERGPALPCEGVPDAAYGTDPTVLKIGWGRHLGWGLRRLWLVGPVLLAVAFLGSVILNWNRVSADIYNVGAVPVCLIKTPGTAPMLVHAGSRFSGRRVAQRLQQQSVNRLSVRKFLQDVLNRNPGTAFLGSIIIGWRYQELLFR